MILFQYFCGTKDHIVFTRIRNQNPAHITRAIVRFIERFTKSGDNRDIHFDALHFQHEILRNQSIRVTGENHDFFCLKH